MPTGDHFVARPLDLTRVALEEALVEGELEKYRGLVETLAGEYDIFDLAAAAVKLADRARDGAGEDEAEIPSFAPPPAPAATRTAKPRARANDAGVARIYVGLGRSAGIRPADLVGAIANEARINSRDIGAIDIADRFSLVEVPAASIDRIVAALRGTSIRGKKVSARRDRGK